MGTRQEEVLADNPVAYWRLGESSGTVVTDISGNGFDGTNNGATVGVPGIPDDPDTAYSFDGSSDYLEFTPFPYAWDAGTFFIIEFWLNVAAYANDGARAFSSCALGCWDTDAAETFIVVPNDSGGEFVVDFVNSGPSHTKISFPRPAVDIFHQYVFCFQNTGPTEVITAWVDGAPISPTLHSTAVGGQPVPATLYAMSKQGTSNFLAGTLDEIALYSPGACLTDDRVRAHYLAEVPPPESCNLRSIDEILFVDATNQDVNVTLFEGESLPAIGYSHIYYIKRIDDSANAVTIDPTPTTIDGLTSLTLEPWDAIAIVTDGYSWFRV